MTVRRGAKVSQHQPIGSGCQSLLGSGLLTSLTILLARQIRPRAPATFLVPACVLMLRPGYLRIIPGCFVRPVVCCPQLRGCCPPQCACCPWPFTGYTRLLVSSSVYCPWLFALSRLPSSLATRTSSSATYAPSIVAHVLFLVYRAFSPPACLRIIPGCLCTSLTAHVTLLASRASFLVTRMKPPSHPCRLGIRRDLNVSICPGVVLSHLCVVFTYSRQAKGRSSDGTIHGTIHGTII
jgi:hypothetical protein